MIASNLFAGCWGGNAWLRHQPSVGFWYALRIAQAAVVLQVGLGAILLLSGREGNGLHYLYGVLPILVSLLAEGARAGRETGIMAVSALVIFLLALRAATTAG